MTQRLLALDRSSIKRVLRIAGLEDAAHRLVRTYSLGMHQPLGQGRYLARFYLSMTGLWHLAFQASASGFLPTHQLITLQMG